MIRLEDIPNKEELVQKYYSWLLDSNNIVLEKQLDLSLVQSYYDPHIYYPECMHDLFHTQSLQRLGRIGHLGLMFQDYPGAYHSRLEHSIGTFGKKQEEHIYLWLKNPDFVRYVEKYNLKKFLIAEEVKMLYHDVGHFPFSHVTEQQIIGKREVHEDVGRNILLTDSEISNATSQLGISDALKTVVSQDILNSLEHDEGNIDVDRKDYLQRDAIHIGGPNLLPYPVYTRQFAEINPDGSYKKTPDGHIILSDSLSSHSKFIDVYANADFSKVEEFLNGRSIQYPNKYFSSSTLARDTIFGYIMSNIAPLYPNQCPDLVEYINLLKSHNYMQARNWDDVRIYKSLVELGLTCQDPNVIDMISLIFSPLDNWLELMYEQLDKTKDANFIRTIHDDLICGNSRFALNVRNKKFFEQNVIFADGKQSSALRRKGFSDLIYSSHSFSAYNPSCPIFVKDANGNVFALEDHPERTRDWRNTKTYSELAICIVPLLKLKGLSSVKIAEYAHECKKLEADTCIDTSLQPTTNMKHFQTHHSIYSYFSTDAEAR